MASVTLATLRSRVRELADQQNSQFVTDANASLDSFINASCQRLHLRLAQKMGADYSFSSSSFTTTANTTDYALPATLVHLLGVDLTINGQQIALKPFQFSERAARRLFSATVPRYRKLAGNIELLPAPTSVLSGTFYFVPELSLLVNSSDTVNFPAGIEEWAVVDTAIQVMLKEESDVSALMARLSQIEHDIEELASNRDLGSPDSVSDVEIEGFDLTRWGW